MLNVMPEGSSWKYLLNAYPVVVCPSSTFPLTWKYPSSKSAPYNQVWYRFPFICITTGLPPIFPVHVPFRFACA